MSATQILRKPKKSIFLGKIQENKYRVRSIEWYCYEEPHIVKETSTLHREKVLEIDMDFEFNEREEVYIEQLGKYTTIEKKSRSIDGSIYYNIPHVIDTVEDEDSKIQAEKDLIPLLEEYKVKSKEREEQIKKSIAESEKYNKEYELVKDERSKVKEFKGVIIQKIPLNSNGKPSLTANEIAIFRKEAIMKLPKDYIILTTPLDINIINFNNKEKLERQIQELNDKNTYID